MRTCGRPFSILINANNELFSVWLGADPSRRGQPPLGSGYSCTNDRFHPSSPIPQSHMASRSIRRQQQPIAPARSRPTDRQSSCGLDSDEGEPQYRFRWDTCPSFFPTSLFRCPGFPQPFRFVLRDRGGDLFLPLSLIL